MHDCPFHIKCKASALVVYICCNSVCTLASLLSNEGLHLRVYILSPVLAHSLSIFEGKGEQV